MVTNKFIEEIHSLCEDKNVEYIDAIVMWCEKNNIEVETAATWIKKDSTMKSRVQAEAENINVLKRGAQLPV